MFNKAIHKELDAIVKTLGLMSNNIKQLSDLVIEQNKRIMELENGRT